MKYFIAILIISLLSLNNACDWPWDNDDDPTPTPSPSASASPSASPSASASPTPWVSKTVLTIQNVNGHDKFFVNGQQTFLLGYSYYGGLASKAPGNSLAEIKHDLLWMKHYFHKQGHTTSWFRLWIGWNYIPQDASAFNLDAQVVPHNWNKLIELIKFADLNGIVVDITTHMCRSGWHANCDPYEPWNSPEQLKQSWIWIANQLKPYRNLYFDIANEHRIYDARYMEKAEILQIRNKIKQIDPNRLVTASSNEWNLVQDEQLDFLSPHLCRQYDFWKCTRDFLNNTLPLLNGKGIHLQEPARNGYGGQFYNWKQFCMDLKAAKDFGGMGWCLHNQASFWLDQQSFIPMLDNEERAFIGEAHKVFTDPNYNCGN